LAYEVVVDEMNPVVMMMNDAVGMEDIYLIDV
jgi:hypothetical protein